MRRRRSKLIQRRIPGVQRERANTYLHPLVKRELKALARAENRSMSSMVARLIMRHWHLSED
jgi:hypothetical protein